MKNMYDEDIYQENQMMDELQFSVNMWLVGGQLDRKELDIKLEKKKVGKIIFEVQAFTLEGYASTLLDHTIKLEDNSCKTKQCIMKIKAFDAKDVIKMDITGKPDPYLRLGQKEMYVIGNTRNLIWNEELTIL